MQFFMGMDIKTAFSCQTCRTYFDGADAQRAHFQSALHAFNVRRKVVNLVPVTQQQFDEKVAAASEPEQEKVR